jgi:hypothetical protein
MKNIIGLVMCGVIGGNILYNSYIEPAMQPIVVYAAQEEETPKEVLIEIEINWTKERIKEEIQTVADEYGVSAEVMNTVINCESQYNKKALGDHGHSRGLVQIHNEYHDVTDAEAYDPAFAIDFLAKHLKAGQGHLWSCYNMNYE